MTVFDVRIDSARAVRIDDEISRRGIELKRVGAELIGPCPQCGGDDRFAVHVHKQVFNCRGCGAKGDVIALVEFLDGTDFKTACATLAGGLHDRRGSEVRPVSQKKNDLTSASKTNDQHRKAAWLWSQRKPITNTIAEKYLRQARGIACALPATLAYLPPQKPGHHPAMIAAFAMVDEPEPGILAAPRSVGSVHLTLLKLDGSGKADVKKPKLIIGSPADLPITLAPPNDLLALAITEGIEDGLALYEALGIGAWAAGAAGFLPKLAPRVPDWIDCVNLEMHPDRGRRFTEELADALRARGIQVFIREAVG